MKIPKELEDVFRGVELTEDEIRTLTWIAGWKSQTVENLRSAIQKVRATALSTLQAENEKLRAELERMRSEPGQELWSAENQRADRLEEELEKVKRERDAAQSLLAEKIGVIDAEPITTAFGLPLDRLRELAQADREGKIPKYTIGDTIYDRFGDAWEITAVEHHLLAGEPKWIYRCGHIGTNDYCALWEFEVLTRADAEAALRREQDD